MNVWIELVGWMGAALTLTAYSSRTMLPLRSAAVFANVSFIVYGALVPVYPTLALHLALLPLNGWRLWQIVALTRQANAARGQGDAFGWIAKVQKPERVPAKTRLFAAGDEADYLYYLVAGKIRLEEIGKVIGPGTLFGEIAFFSEGRTRTATAICQTDCEIVALDEARFLAAFHQDPTFGLAIVRLVARRLIENAPMGDTHPATPLARNQPAKQRAEPG